jgi:Uma2 family endonuclease
MSINISRTIENISTQSPSPVYKNRVTFEEYLAMHGDATMSEWVDGEVIIMAAAAADHQRIGSFIETVMKLFVEIHDLGEVFRSPFVMKLEALSRGREPDILFISKKRSHLLQKTYLDGAADLTVEIISPESVERDTEEKFFEYEAAGVKEYWLIDPNYKTAEFYQLGKDGHYRRIKVGADGIYRSKVLRGFFLRVEWLWEMPSPTVEALCELKLF